MEKQSLPQTENLQFQFSFFRNTWSKESTIITLHNLYLQTIGTLWKAQTECYRKLQDRPDRSNEAKMVKDAMPVVIIEGICRRIAAMPQQSGKDEPTSHVRPRPPERTDICRQSPFPCSPLRGLHADQYLRQRPQSRRISRCPHPGRVSSRLRHLPADTGTHRRASVRPNSAASPSPVLAYGMPMPTTIPLPNLIRGGKNSTPTLR